VTLFLGVDGGGSKTAFVLVDDAGAVRAEAVASTTYILGDDGRSVSRVLADGIESVCAQAEIQPGQIAQAFFGLPGYGESEVGTRTLDRLPASLLGHDRYSCGNDMICGWAGSLGGADGINVISGTGSMTYGENRGVGCRVGGWGELFGDEGSGYWIAARGLNAFTRMSDGRLPRTALYALLKSHLGIESDLFALEVILTTWGGRRDAIAALSRVVADAGQAGDPVATRILEDAATELVALVDATRTGLGFADDEVVAVSYSGGVFGAEAVRSSFTRALASDGRQYDLRQPLASPVVGAAIYAARMAGTPLASAAIARLSRP
jgi:N-acetylglucosamine kinase-like BadF-type ATPase